MHRPASCNTVIQFKMWRAVGLQNPVMYTATPNLQHWLFPHLFSYQQMVSLASLAIVSSALQVVSCSVVLTAVYLAPGTELTVGAQ